MRDRRLLRAVLLLLLTIALASILIASYSAARIESQLSSTDDPATNALSATLSMQANVFQTAEEAFAYVISGEVVERDEARAELRAFNDIVADLESIPRPSDGQERALLTTIVDDHRTFESTTDLLFAQYEAAGTVTPALLQQYEGTIDDLAANIAELVEIEREGVVLAQAATRRTEQRARDSVLRQGFIIGALALVAAAITLWLFRSLRDSREDARRDLDIHLQALEATNIGVAIGDVRRDDDPVIYVNRGFEDMTGYRRDEIIGTHLRLLDGPRTAPDATEMLDRCVANGESGSTIMENYTADGRAMWNAVQISPIRDRSGGVTHYVEVLEDISDRVRLENRLLQAGKMDAVGQLAGGIAHDFNNYLMVISAAVEMIRRDPSADITHWLDQLDEAGKRSAALTSQLLMFARAQVVNVETVDLTAVVASVVPLLRSTIREDISIEWRAAEASCLVSADRSQLDQVVTNIVINARDALPDGGSIVIETSVEHLTPADVDGEPRTAAGRYVMLAITDTGTGIDPAVIDDIFEPFATTKPVGLGSGLGLSTVYGIVTQAGGLIRVDSEPDHGTTVRVYLPLVDAADPIDGHEPARDEVVGFEEHVLLVEDDDTVRHALRAMLTTLGFSVSEATNGVEALEFLTAHPDVPLIVSDVTMPEMGGLELAEHARATRPDIKILLVSGYTDDHHARDDGGDPLLSKPFRLDDLRSRLADLLDR